MGLENKKDGIYFDITDAEYFGDKERVNCSLVKRIIKNKSTSYAKEEVKTTKAMRLGTLFHTMVLEPKEFYERAVIVPDVKFSTKEGKEIKKMFSDCVFLDDESSDNDKGKKIAIKDEDLKMLEAWEAGLLIGADGTETEAARLIKEDGYVECVVLFTYLGVPCKIKIDKLLKSHHILDVKTCQSCEKKEFGEAVFKMGYYLQSYFYKLAFNCLAGEDVNIPFTFLAVEKTDNIWLSQCHRTTKWDGYAKELIDYWLPLTYKAIKTKEYGTYQGHNQNAIMEVDIPHWIEQKLKEMLGC